ncbi:hypothetical protein D3795_09495 [Pseudidiomarina andamanensis]|uniref:Uncharacterized protein n=1 Tax=Pseudidiomarina andamanensis TaxID=1940690 RepID=A0AA92IMR2_9GAMM|nr:hypothetical protein D3795_09495 [Pseudidiomarina andamanensis]
MTLTVVLSKLLSLLNMTEAEVSRIKGIGVQTLYNWLDKTKLQGKGQPSLISGNCLNVSQ